MRVGRLLKNALNFTDQKKLPKLDLDMIQNQIGDKVFDSLNRTFSERQSDLNNSQLTIQELEELVNRYSKQNMAIALSSGLIPGPLGIFSAVPELVMTMKNQMAMIYDFSCGYDKESFINKDILLDIPIYALGGKTNLSVLQDRSNLTDSSEAILKSKALDLGKGLIERNLKKSLVKFIPIGGPLVMATWAKMSTQKVGAASKVFFDDNEHFVDQTPELPQSLETQLTVTKIKVMINLMEVDGDIHADEISFITPIIDHVDIPKSDKLALLEEAEKIGSAHILMKLIP